MENEEEDGVHVVTQGFLFETGSARAFHESESQQQEALRILRHRKLTKVSFERDFANGSRLAPAIDVLRNGWGFEIAGAGTTKDPYWMINPKQSPTKVRDRKIQPLYYESEHWCETREKRFKNDNYRCVFCVASCRDSIECHHIKYSLFNEKLDELITVCEYHHQVIHENSAIGFPIGVELWIAERLLEVVAYPFEEWLLP
jgi:hypothetical protein